MKKTFKLGLLSAVASIMALPVAAIIMHNPPMY